MTELVGIREAARRLRARGQPIDASTISRNVRSGIVPNRGTPEHPLVDVGEVVAARAAGLDHMKRRMPSPPETGAGVPGAPPAGPLYQQVRTAREGYAAKLAQVDYEERVGNLVAVEEVRDAAFELGQLMRQLMAGRVEALAAAIKRLAPPANLDDIIAEIIASDQEWQQKLADGIARTFGGGQDDNANGE